MTCFAIVISFLCCVHFVSYPKPCEGKITLPPGGNTIVVAPGTARVEIAWTFDDTITAGTLRRWNFVTKNEPLAVLFGTGSSVTKLSSLFEFEIKDKATLVLKNVNSSYDGTYEFSIQHAVTPERSRVSVFIAGKITIVNDIKYALPGDNVTIEWNITNPISDLFLRAWIFVRTGEQLARIDNNDELTVEASSLPGIKVKKPSTLILENVDDKYDGKYSLQYIAATVGDTSGISYVTVIVAAKATVTINCSSSTTVDEGDDVRCLCKGEGGNPPANVTWYKDGEQIGVAGDEEKMLTLSSIDKTASGTYKCVAQSYTLKNEESIDLFVHYPPEKPVFFGIPKIVEVGKAVVMICCANALPAPSVTIMHNNTTVISANYNYIFINVVEYKHAGLYKCIAKNRLGTSSKDFILVVVGKD